MSVESEVRKEVENQMFKVVEKVRHFGSKIRCLPREEQ